MGKIDNLVASAMIQALKPLDLGSNNFKFRKGIHIDSRDLQKTLILGFLWCRVLKGGVFRLTTRQQKFSGIYSVVKNQSRVLFLIFGLLGDELDRNGKIWDAQNDNLSTD